MKTTINVLSFLIIALLLNVAGINKNNLKNGEKVSAIKTCDNLLITSRKYSEKENLNQKVKDEFGNNYKIADWNDLKMIPNIDEWISCMNLHDKDSFIVTRGGKYTYGSVRQYFVTYFASGNVPSSWLVHDQIGNKLFLGSWYGLNKPILGIKQKEGVISKKNKQLKPIDLTVGNSKYQIMGISTKNNVTPNKKNKKIRRPRKVKIIIDTIYTELNISNVPDGEQLTFSKINENTKKKKKNIFDRISDFANFTDKLLRHDAIALAVGFSEPYNFEMGNERVPKVGYGDGKGFVFKDNSLGVNGKKSRIISHSGIQAKVRPGESLKINLYIYTYSIENYFYPCCGSPERLISIRLLNSVEIPVSNSAIYSLTIFYDGSNWKLKYEKTKNL